jgi:hypothetical protein
MRTDAEALLPAEAAARKQRSRQRILCEALGLSYNLETVATYWISADNFPKHMGWLKQPISNFSPLGTIAPFILFCVAEVFLFATNQRKIPIKIAKLLGHKHLEQYQDVCCSATWVNAETNIGAAWKAVVSTTSFWALANDILQAVPFIAEVDGLSLGLSAGLAFILLWPNFASQYVNFSDASSKLQSCQYPKLLASFGGIGYGLCNGALYFNTFDKVFNPWLGSNLSELDSPAKIILFVINAIFSSHFTVKTSRCYSKLIFQQLTLQDLFYRDTMSQTSDSPVTSLQDHLSTSGHIAAIWKVVVTSLSLINISSELGSSTAGFVLAGLFLVGNYLAQKNFFIEKVDAKSIAKDNCGRCCPKLFGYSAVVEDGEAFRAVGDGVDTAEFTV